MAYTNKQIPNDPTMFPAPQNWITWVANFGYDFSDNKRRITPGNGAGKVRHHYTLADARKSLMWIGSRSKYKESYWDNIVGGEFMADWAIYHWNGSEWEKVFSGVQGEARDTNPLFRRDGSWKEVAEDGGKSFAEGIDAKMEEQAIASILSAVAS